MIEELRPYQAAGVQSLRIALSGGNKRVLCYSPTGSGKTLLAIAMIWGALAKGKRVTFLCNRIGLVQQASQRFFRSGIAHGVVQGENTCNLHEPAIVASIQTAARRGMPDSDLIIIDEAHGTAGSKDYREVLFRYNNVPVIGLSATPFAKGLAKEYDELKGPLFQSLVVVSTIPELIDAGYLVDVDIYAPSEPDMTGVKTSRNAFGEIDFSDFSVAEAVDKPQLVGDIVTHWLRLANGTPTVCFAANIAHSQHIVENFRAAGVAAEHIDCYTTDDERQAILRRVERGETTVISNVGILAEGWDFPACQTMILARPTRSLIRYIQMAGRVLRPHETKTRALILDHSGTVSRLGFPTDDLPLELDDGTPKKSTSKQEKPLPKPCPKCAFVKPPRTPVCPRCGTVTQRQNEITEIEGELVKASRKKVKIEDKQAVFSQLLSIQMSKGYSNGWTYHKYLAYFGCAPHHSIRHDCAEPTPEILSWVKSQNIRYAKRKLKSQQQEAAHAA